MYRDMATIELPEDTPKRSLLPTKEETDDFIFLLAVLAILSGILGLRLFEEQSP